MKRLKFVLIALLAKKSLGTNLKSLNFAVYD